MRKAVMMKAWEIARHGQEQFGGKASEYLSEAMKMAWGIIKFDERDFASNKAIFTKLSTELEELTIRCNEINPEVKIMKSEKLLKNITPYNAKIGINNVRKMVNHYTSHLSRMGLKVA